MTAKTNQNAWIVKVTMLLYQEIAQNGKLRKTSWPSNTQKKFIRRCSQTFATLFRPIKGFICNCNTDPSSIIKTTSTLGRLPIDFKTEIEYLKYILNYCLTRLDTLDEITPENPVPRDAPSSDEAPPPPQTTPEQKKWIHNPECWVYYAIWSFKWCQQRWEWNRNADNEQ